MKDVQFHPLEDNILVSGSEVYINIIKDGKLRIHRIDETVT